ncbi:MAG: T9SS type A sorting domain-containing protein [Crocinitomicaceae bacterium]|nr:T9SS type A sorting domain-containing protein [Crocinitomicaceae bacterium]
MLIRQIAAVLFLFLSFNVSIFCQIGCTDPQASNYDPLASVNDGSCVYGTTNYSPNLIGDLSFNLNENSGLIYWSNKLVTFNDSGGANKIYLLDSLGNILQAITISNSQNIDWEAIAQSSDSIFIGDFGNNSGSRQNLCIYSVSKNDLLNTSNDTVTANKLEFEYVDQTVFSNQYENHNYDCEAFFFDNDSLHLFTKNWSNLYTSHYVIPTSNPSIYSAIIRDSFFVDGLITDVTLDSINDKILLLGYKNNGSNFYTSFIYLLFDYSSGNYFSGNKRRIEIGSMLEVSQTEGITWIDSLTGFISSEEISSIITIAPKLFSFDFSSYLTNSLSQTDLLSNSYRVFPNPVCENLIIPKDMKRYSILNHTGKVIIENINDMSNPTIDVKFLQPGNYFLKDHLNNQVYKFVKLNN